MLEKVPCQDFWAFPGAYLSDLQYTGDWLQI
jgi:hypothetical protein